MEDRHRRGRGAQRGPARCEIPWPRALATMEWIPPPEPRRDEDALRETVGATPHGEGLRSPGCRTSGPYCRPERLHCARHTRHRSYGMSLSGERGPTAIRPSVQQSRCPRSTPGCCPVDIRFYAAAQGRGRDQPGVVKTIAGPRTAFVTLRGRSGSGSSRTCFRRVHPRDSDDQRPA